MAVKKTAAKKPAAKKAAPAKAPAPKAIGTKQTKTQIVAALAEQTGLTKKDITAVFSATAGLVAAHMKKNGSGEFAVPELGLKIRRRIRPATKARKGRDPKTGQEITVKAKPARNVVRVTALKWLKETVK